MLPRINHNLVLLPDGTTLVVGGMDGSTPVRRPQIWSPSSGAWTDTTEANRLANLLVTRDYHSTAVLLPDGRVLSAGGDVSVPDRQSFNVFCPPYLFKTDGSAMAARPKITASPGPATSTYWGRTFTVCVDDTVGIRGAALIRSSATTHSFDENQRFIPLTFTVPTSSDKRLLVNVPADSAVAPPGYYMLFLTGSPDRGNVPSIAHWVRIGRAWHRDTCDVTKAGTITDLQPDVVGSSSALMLWSTPPDDASLSQSGWPNKFHMRQSTGLINSESSWNSASAVTVQGGALPAPQTVGELRSAEVTGLSSCTTYHLAVRAEDDNYNTTPLSDLHDDVSFQTTGTGCGGFVAQDPGGSFAASASAETNGTSGTSSSRLMIEPTRTVEGWTLTVRHATESDQPGSSDETQAVVQVREGGVWTTRGSLQVGETDARLAIGSLRENARIILPAGYQPGEAAVDLRAGPTRYRLDEARHSQLGDVTSPPGESSNLSLQLGDSLVLKYAQDASPAEGATAWYLITSRTAAAPSSRARSGDPPGPELPKSFALRTNQPNPFRGTTVIPFELPRESQVQIEVFDLLGRRVAVLANASYAAGTHSVEWDMRDSQGGTARPGIYVCRMAAGEFRARMKLTVLP